MLAWRKEARRPNRQPCPQLLLGIVSLQAALGMWTVTLLLKPVIVTCICSAA
jgi:cytochrome c oxidase assembly protein subunit 15